MTITLRDRTGSRPRQLALLSLFGLVAVTALDPSASSTAAADTAPASSDPFDLVAANHFPQMFGEYPDAPITSMGRLNANGNSMEMHYFITRDAPQQVLGHFADQFGKHGHVDSQGEERFGMVSYYEPSLGSFVTVQARQQGEGKEATTVAFAAIIDAADGLSLVAEPPRGVPSAPSAITVARVEDRNSGRAAGSLTYTQIAEGHPAQLAEFYRKEMVESGYQLASSNDQSGVSQLEYEGPGRVSISIAPMSDTSSVITLIMEKRR